MDAGADDGEGGAGEDVGVVALAGLVGLAEAVEGWEGRAGGEDSSARAITPTSSPVPALESLLLASTTSQMLSSFLLQKAWLTW